jgi:hypothetical protein
MFAYFLPAVLDYNDHMEEVEKAKAKENKKDNKKDSAFRPEFLFVVIAYFTGVLFTTLPGSGFCDLSSQE